MRPETAATIARYAPRSLSPEAACFARAAVAGCLPEHPARAKALLFAVGRLGEFCCSVGLELSPRVCLQTSVIERFIVSGCAKVSPATRRTLRTNLRFVARRLVAETVSPLALSRERAKPPYREDEIASYLALSDVQATLARRHRLGALICLGAGAGLTGGELRSVRGDDVVSRSGGMIVVVGGGRRPRVVPVLSRYHERLLEAAAFAKDRYVIGGIEPRRENVTDRLVSAVLRTSDLPRLDTGRLRASWLCACAELLGLRAFMDAAGITCSQRLGDLLASLAPVPEGEAMRLLGGRS